MGIEALNNALGLQNALRFLAIFQNHPTCCAEIS
jgi:hypothetical protein